METIPPPGAQPPPPPPGPEALPMPPEPLPPPGWLHDPRDGNRERYWDGAGWTEQTRHANSFKRRFHFSPYWLLGLLVALVVLWGSGLLDKQLVGIGLNAQDCFEKTDGETVCGSEAQELIEAQENPLPPIPPTGTTPGVPPLPGDPNYGVPTTPGGTPAIP